MNKDALGPAFDELLEPGSLMAEVRTINTKTGHPDKLAGYNMTRAVLIAFARRHGIKSQWVDGTQGG